MAGQFYCYFESFIFKTQVKENTPQERFWYYVNVFVGRFEAPQIRVCPHDTQFGTVLNLTVSLKPQVRINHK